jgi:protein transport protein SEC24
MLQQQYDASEGGDQSRATAQSALLDRCERLLACYRLHTKAINSPLGQLILPEKLQLLPLFCTSLIKSPILRPSLPKRGSGLRATAPSPSADERAIYLWQAATMSSPAYALLMVYPNVFPIADLQGEDGAWQMPERPQQQPSNNVDMCEIALERYVQMPPTLHPTISSLSDDGIYLVDACFALYLYIGRSVSKEMVQNLEFAVAEEMGPRGSSSSSSSEDDPHPIARLVWQLRKFCQVGGGSESMVRPTFAPVVLVKDTGNHDDELSRDINRWMVCDATSHEKDYVDFLCDIHRQIRTRVDTGKS